MKEYYCMDCGELLEQPFPGILAGASLVTDGCKNVKEFVPGGAIFGNKLGYRCADCSLSIRNERDATQSDQE